jgi:hypothetical protein
MTRWRVRLKEAQVEAQRMIEATEAALAEDPHLLNEARPPRSRRRSPSWPKPWQATIAG